MEETDRKALFTDNQVREFLIQYGTLNNLYPSKEWERNYKLLLILRDRIESRCRNNSLEELWNETVAWSNVTFPKSTPRSIAAHLLSEARELAATPYDGSEVADIALLLGHLVSTLGINLVAMTRQKFDINRRRNWGDINEQGFVEHVKEEGEEEKPKGESRPSVEVDALWNERVFETNNTTKTGRVGTITFYKIGSRTFAKPPIWDEEP